MTTAATILERFLSWLAVPPVREALDRLGYPGAIVFGFGLVALLRRKVSSPIAC